MIINCEKCDSNHRLIKMMTIGCYDREIHECQKCGHVLMDEPRPMAIYRLELVEPPSRSSGIE